MCMQYKDHLGDDRCYVHEWPGDAVERDTPLRGSARLTDSAMIHTVHHHQALQIIACAFVYTFLHACLSRSRVAYGWYGVVQPFCHRPHT